MFSECIGNIIKTIRKNKKLTQEALADLLNTDKQFISKIEKGKVNITLNYVDKILKQLKTNPKDIFNQSN